ncbi:flagellar hook-length control protein FliK [Granulosicoccus sp. 3-233]|uniref:flagellar hook-length control protein FliK n=1 Tax=Granulosicoccus sp. 3-233 TaxID=3417969 RepID=UPI003D34E782
MSEPSNTSVQGLIGSLSAAGKPAAAKGQIDPGSGNPDGKAFSRELGQALEQQSSQTSLAGEKPLVKPGSRPVTTPDPAVAGVAPAADADQEVPEILATVTSGDAEQETVSAAASVRKIELPELSPETDLVTRDTGSVAAAERLADRGSEAVEDLKAAPTTERPVSADGKAPTVRPSAAVEEQSEQLPDSLTEELARDVSKAARSATVTETADQAMLPDSPDTRPKVSDAPASSVQTTAVDKSGRTDLLTGSDEAGIDSIASPGKRPGSVAAPLTPAVPAAATTPPLPAQTVGLSPGQTPPSPVTPEVASTTGMISDVETLPGSKPLPVVSDEGVSLTSESGVRSPATLKADQRPVAQVPGATAGPAVAAAPDNEALPATRTVRSTVATQPAEVGEVISQAALAARYRFATQETGGRLATPAADDSQTPVMSAGISVDGKAVAPGQLVATAAPAGNSLTEQSAERGGEARAVQLSAAEMTLDDGEPVLRHADLLKELNNQRAALKDSIAPPGAQAATNPVDVLVKTASTDNTFLPVTGGIVTAPVMLRSDAVSATPVSAPFDLPVLVDDADATMASNVKWMVKEGVQNATVTVSPAGMGPISVKVGIEQDQMSVSIVASQHTTREALDAMLPRLREQLAGQGHESVRLDVSDGRGEQSRGGNGQMFAGMRNPSDTWAQSEQGNGGGNGNQAEYGDSRDSTGNTDGYMAEDLQRVVPGIAGDGRTSSAFDAYV